MRHFLGIVAFICLSVPLHAQWTKSLQNFFTRAGSQRVLSAAIERKAAASVAAKKSLPAELQNSVFTIKENHFIYKYLNNNLRASGFVISENYQGKTYLWGVSAAHYHFETPALEETPRGRAKNVKVSAQGNDQTSDLVLFPIPEKVAHLFTPLTLATELPQRGDVLHSIGFFQNKFQHEVGRTVYEVNPYSMTTKIATNPMELHYRRIGACGGPILNDKNEVVGVHTGSSSGASVGYAIPVTQLHRLLNAYHTGQDKTPIKIAQETVGMLDVTENLEYIEVWHHNQLKIVLPFRKGINYDDLDTFLYPATMDKVRLIVRKTPLTNKGKTHRFILTYNFANQQMTYEQKDSYLPPNSAENRY